MDKFVIGPVTSHSKGDKNLIRATISSPAAITELWFGVSSSHTLCSGEDFLLPASLFCAMQTSLPLHIRGSISRQLANKIDLLQTIFNKWYPQCEKIKVTWDALSDTHSPAGSGTGCFFSGGLDSFYTLLKHQDKIDALVLVHGFDFWLDDHMLRQQVSSTLQEIAEKFGKPLIEVETNLREFTDQFLDWGQHCIGSGLASISLLLSGELSKLYVPASQNYAHLEPTGSHLLLDPLWSTENIKIVHDGFEATRIEKAQLIAQSDIALTHLRVCYQNLLEKGRYSERSWKWNCGRCEKCVRTMLNLYLAGALDKCPTFRTLLTPDLIRSTNLKDHASFIHMEDNFLALKKKEKDSDLVRALGEIIDNYHHRIIIQLMEKQPSFFYSEPWADFSKRRRNTLFKSMYSLWGYWMTRESLKEELKKLLFYKR